MISLASLELRVRTAQSLVALDLVRLINSRCFVYSNSLGLLCRIDYGLVSPNMYLSQRLQA